MDYFLKTYTARCRKEIVPLGFKRKGQAYFRITNDVMQCFWLKRWRTGWICTIEFGIIPLCYRIPWLELGGYDLSGFNIINNSHGWDYNKSINETVDQCIDGLFFAIHEYLLPLFNRANSCETALSELIALEKLFNDNRLLRLKAKGGTDMAGPGAGLNLSDSYKCFMAIKNGDYDFAIKSKKALLNQNLRAYEKRRTYTFLSEGTLEKDRSDISDLKLEIHRLGSGDTAYFQKLIDENEAYSRDFLSKI